MADPTMNQGMFLTFVVSVVLVFHAYFGYPLSLFLIGLVRKMSVARQDIFPSVSLIITVFNEESRVREKLENTLAIDSPEGMLEILVVSDGSTDGTNRIVREYTDRGVTLLPFAERKGKENAQREAVSQAKGSLFVFTDVATMLDPGSLKRIVSNFADPTVGCVSGEDRMIGEGESSGGEGLYVRYEMWLRRLETDAHSLVGSSGSFFAARREACRDFSGNMQSDFRTVLNTVKMGLRAVNDPEALGHYRDVSDSNREFDRKVRTVVRGLTVFFQNVEFLNVAKYGFFGYQYFCHKLLRWLVPFFLMTAFVSNAFLAGNGRVFLLLFLLQLVFYLYGAFRILKTSNSLGTLAKIPVYFVTVNASILLAWWKYLRGERIVMWKPSVR
jgi:cellulose synthase/poly-beta-1,6-N-acetylglucosamine synthase-like glycosyltransferase